MSNKLKTINKLNISLFIAISASMGINTASSYIKYANVDSIRYNKSVLGTPVAAQLGLDNSLDVVIDKNFSTEQKGYIEKAIKELDIDLKGVDYNILLDGNKTGDNCVNIFKSTVKPNDNSALAETIVKHNIFMGYVVFPAQINVFMNTVDRSFGDRINYEDYMSAIIKHEMLHVLGFADIYDRDYLNQTIMYGEINNFTRLFDLSEEDVKMVNSVYKEKHRPQVSTQIYEPIYIEPTPEQIKEDEESL